MPSLLLRIVALLFFFGYAELHAAAPVLSAPSSTVGTNGTATLSVTVNPGGLATAVTFNYGLTMAYGTSRVANVSSTATTASVALTGLTGGQTYHFQVTATNSDGSAMPTTDASFVVPPYAVTGAATTVAGKAKLNGTVSARGFPGKAHFEYGLTTTYELGSTTPDVDVTGTSDSQPIQSTKDMLARDMVYHFRIVYVDDATMTVRRGDDGQFRTNNSPIANTDTVNSAGAGPTTIRPLTNDSDPDGKVDKLSLVEVATQPKFGTATKDGDTIIYTPNPGSVEGFDSFTYTIEDPYNAMATGTINIRSIRGAFAGTHGGFVKRINGKEAGYFTVTATANGNFTGIALIEGKRYVVSGAISADGVYRGWAINGASILPVFIFTDQADTSSTVTALFGGGQWSSELNISPDERVTRGELTGRYTVGLSGGSTTATSSSTSTSLDPEGTGWAALRVRDDGTAVIKGRLADGRSFSTRGTVDIIDGVATLSFFDDPDATRVVGKFTLGDDVGGTMQTDRHSSGEGRFPRGFDETATASGARYVVPEDGKRVLDTTSSKGSDLAIAFTGGGLTSSLSRQLTLDDNDRVHVTDASGEDLRLRIDRKSGRFQTKVTVGNDGTRIKATGVFIQATRTTDSSTGITSFSGSGRGLGIFNTSAGTGTVTISGGGSTTTPTTPTTPTPTTPIAPADPTITDPTVVP